MAPPSILVTGGGSATALTVLKGIRLDPDLDECRVLLGDCSTLIAGRHLADGFVQLPRADDDEFIDRMAEACTNNDVGLLVPIFDPELEPLALHKDRFLKAGIRVALPSVATVRACRDKLETVRRFAAIGAPHPATYSAEGARALGPGSFPMIVRPRDGRSSEHVVRVHDHPELERALRQVPNAFVQHDVSHRSAREVTVDVFVREDGRFHGACPRERQVVRAGQSYKGRTIDAPEVVRWSQAICEGLGLIGPACLQCFVRNDQPSFFEVNPRFGAASILSMHAGLNMAALLVRETLDMPMPSPSVRAGVQMLRYWEEVITIDAQPCSIGGLAELRARRRS